MRYTQYTQDELRSMSLADLKKVDIYSADEEKHVQLLMNIQMEKFPAVMPANPLVFPHSVTDSIKTLEQEQALQREMDEHNEMVKRNIMGEIEPEAEATEPTLEDIEPESEEAAAPVMDRFCAHCDSRGGRHKRECTREMVTA